MANRFWCITLEEAKRTVKIEDVLDDEGYVRAIRAASAVMPRQFFVQTRTLPFTARHRDRLQIGAMELLAVTSLATDDGSRTYSAVWNPSEYDLEPSENPYLDPPHPYWKVCTVPQGTRHFPVGLARGVQIAGRWGFYDIRRDTGITLDLTDGMNASQTTMPISAADIIETGHTLHVDDEDLFVTHVEHLELTVERGVNGTTPATHADGSAIEVYTYPLVDQAGGILVNKWVRRLRDAPMGIVGSIDGFMRLAINDPDVVSLIGRLHQPTVPGV